MVLMFIFCGAVLVFGAGFGLRHHITAQKMPATRSDVFVGTFVCTDSFVLGAAAQSLSSTDRPVHAYSRQKIPLPPIELVAFEWGGSSTTTDHDYGQERG